MLPVKRQPGRDALGGQQQVTTEATGRAEHGDVGLLPVGAPEGRGEVEDAADVGAAERVDRLVRVADDGEVAAVARELAEQRHLAGVGVLVLVDEDVP